MFREDRVSQEINEMLALRLVMTGGNFPGNADLRTRLDLTIEDATGKASNILPLIRRASW